MRRPAASRSGYGSRIPRWPSRFRMMAKALIQRPPATVRGSRTCATGSRRWVGRSSYAARRRLARRSKGAFPSNPANPDKIPAPSEFGTVTGLRGFSMQAYQSAPCLYCGASWNPPGAQACVKCHNPLPAAQAGYQAPFPGPQTAAVPVANRGFYRSPLRTFLFALVASDAYLVWWAFQLLGFAQRERFPKSGSPWWVLFPFVDLVYTSRAFKGTAAAEKAALGTSSLSLPLANLGFIGALVLSRVTTNIYGTT